MGAAIRVEGLSKRYRLGTGSAELANLRDVLVRRLRPAWSWRRRAERGGAVRGSEWIWALQDVSFDVERGDVVGIIGSNGAGKSTLLKILSRITDPSEGSVRLRGRLSSLLEVGTGFHPELTGRENIYLNGAVLGMRKAEIGRRFDEIVAFAELAAFLDTPVKRYSSGMYVRLAFAVAAHLEPEILMVDEVLAVGDVGFQRKCLGKMGEVSRQGRTVLLVSHNMAAVEHLCRSALVFQHGRLVFRGNVPDAIGHYLRTATGAGDDVRSHVVDLSGARARKPGSPVLLRRLELFTVDGKPLDGGLGVGAPFEARVGLVLERPTVSLELVIRFDNMLGQRILVTSSAFDPAFAGHERTGAQTVVCRIPRLTLMPGEYRLRVALLLGGAEVDAVDDATRLNVVPSDYYGAGRLPQSGAFVLPQSWSVEPE
jgi:lipopolysaccharide transport system ATP-binding protein